MAKVFVLKNTIDRVKKANQIKFAREYRCFSQKELCLNVKGLKQSNLSKFEKGESYISDKILLDILSFLNFPSDFLSTQIKDVKFL